MCGFVGIWNSYESSIDERKANLKKMIIPLTHRGPDDIGFWAKDSKSPGLAIADYQYKIFLILGTNLWLVQAVDM